MSDIGFYVGAALFASASWNFHRLLRWEYEHHRAQWESDGKPTVMFGLRMAEECNYSGSRVAYMALFCFWLCHTPPWVMGSPLCLRWLRRYRISMVVFALVMVLTVLAKFLHGILG